MKALVYDGVETLGFGTCPTLCAAVRMRWCASKPLGFADLTCMPIWVMMRAALPR